MFLLLAILVRLVAAAEFHDAHACVDYATELGEHGNAVEASEVLETCRLLAVRESWSPRTLAQLDYNRGFSFQQQGRINEALKAYHTSISLYGAFEPSLVKVGEDFACPSSLPSLRTLLQTEDLFPIFSGHKAAFLHHERGELQETVALLQQASRLGAPPGQPKNPEVLVRLADTLQNLKRFREAVELHKQALRSLQHAPPSFREQWEGTVYRALGDSLTNMRKASQASKYYRLGIVAAPSDGSLRAALFMNQANLADWNEWDIAVSMAWNTADAAMDKEPSPLSPYRSLFLPLQWPQQTRVSQSWADGILRSLPYLSSAVLSAGGENSTISVPSHRFRLGIISRRFREYAGTQLMLGLFESFPRSRVEVFCFSSGPGDAGPERQRIERDCDFFHDTSELSYPAALRVIQEASLHVLVDYDGQHDFSNLRLLSLRPAPVQVSFLGFPGPMHNMTRVGLSRLVDGTVVDPVLVPPEAARGWGDRIVYLRPTYQPQSERPFLNLTRKVLQHAGIACQSSTEEGGLSKEGWRRQIVDFFRSEQRGERREKLGLPRNGTVLVGFNRLGKVDPSMFRVWMQSLRRHPQSRLWLLGARSPAAANLQREAAAHGVAPERLVFAERASKEEHLARHWSGDLYLDTRWYGGHTSASDALATGMPVVTLPGLAVPSRVGASLNRALIEGKSTIVHSLREYETLTGSLVGGSRVLHRLRARLLARGLCHQSFGSRNNGLFAPVSYANRFVRAMEVLQECLWAGNWAAVVPAAE